MKNDIRVEVKAGLEEYKYSVAIPHSINNIGLDCYAGALYLHIKRFTGEDYTKFYDMDVKAMAKRSKMSVSKLKKAMHLLEKKGLIVMNEGLFRVVDIWDYVAVDGELVKKEN